MKHRSQVKGQVSFWLKSQNKLGEHNSNKGRKSCWMHWNQGNKIGTHTDNYIIT